MGIRAKLLLPLLALVLIVLGAGHFITFAALRDNLVVERMEAEQRALDLVALAIVPDVLAGDLGSIHGSLDEIRRRHPWWRVLTLAGRDGGRLYPLKETAAPVDIPRLSSQVTAAGAVIGGLQISVDIESQVTPALAAIRQLEITVAGMLVLGVLVVVWLQRRWFVIPVVRLAEASRQLSQGRYDTDLPKASADEVGGLIQAFDTMRLAVSQREQQLRDSEGRFRDLAESASDWFWETDAENRLTFVSDRIGEILGVKPSGVLGFTYFDFGLADYDSGIARAHAEDLGAHRPFRDLIFTVGPEGAKDGRIIRISGMPFFDETGAFIGYRGVGANITEMRRRERAVELLTHRYQLILDSAGEGIVELSPKGVVGFANRVAAELLHCRPADMVGRNFAELVRASEADGGVIAAACTAGVAERVNDAAFRRNPDGSAIPVEFLVAPIIENDVIEGAVLVFRDIAMRKHYEKALSNQQAELERLVEVRTAALSLEIQTRAKIEVALRASRKHLKGITDSLFEGVLVVNSARLITFANPSARRLLGLMVGELEGHCLDELLRIDGAAGEPPPWQVAAASSTVVRGDDAIFVVEGRRLAMAFACSPLLDDRGRRGAILSFRDIEALKRAQREAMQSSRLASVGQLAAGIAHEINTPIQYIGDNLGFIKGAMVEIAPLLDGFKQGRPNLDFLLEELPGAIDQSLDGVKQVARIVRSMKEFSHPGSTHQAAVDINRALDSTLTVSSSTWKHLANVETDFAPNLPPVLCRPGEMNQVFLNLIVNAAHAIEGSGKALPGTIRVASRAVGDWVEIEVADSGTGVADDIRDRIFDPFFTTKEVGQGTGQGLAICYDVVVGKHHGQIQVGGRPGEGAVFTVRLPVDEERVVKLDAEADAN